MRALDGIAATCVVDFADSVGERSRKLEQAAGAALRSTDCTFASRSSLQCRIHRRVIRPLAERLDQLGVGIPAMRRARGPSLS